MENEEEKKKIMAEKLAKFLDEEKIEVHGEISFPQYNVLPDDVMLALKVVQNHQGIVRVFVVEKKGEAPAE